MFSLFFAVLLGYGVWFLGATGGLYSVPPWHFLLLSLATFRLVRLFCYDHITEFIRNWFVGAKDDSLRGTLGALLNCPWCTGLWFSFLLVLAYFTTPYAYPVVVILAVAAVGTSFQLLVNLIGWHAEGKKAEVKGK